MVHGGVLEALCIRFTTNCGYGCSMLRFDRSFPQRDLDLHIYPQRT